MEPHDELPGLLIIENLRALDDATTLDVAAWFIRKCVPNLLIISNKNKKLSFLLLIRNKKSIFAESFTRMKQKILERLGYSNRIERMFGRGMMIALTGQRRVGKSCVMRRIYNHIAENEENHVIYIDKEKTSFDMIANYQNLEAYVAANIVEGKENYLFIDEVQEISDFEKALLSIQSDDTCQIMITGSNAKMLSGELATRLRGRYIAYRIRGLCYEEFLTFH